MGNITSKELGPIILMLFIYLLFMIMIGSLFYFSSDKDASKSEDTIDSQVLEATSFTQYLSSFQLQLKDTREPITVYLTNGMGTQQRMVPILNVRGEISNKGYLVKCIYEENGNLGHITIE